MPMQPSPIAETASLPPNVRFSMVTSAEWVWDRARARELRRASPWRMIRPHSGGKPVGHSKGGCMSKRFWISAVVMFVAAMACDFVVHGVLLGRDYAALTPKLFRPEAEAQSYFPFMLLAHAFMAIGITWLYRGGRSTRPWAGQGLRFGLALAFYAVVPTYLIYFA